MTIGLLEKYVVCNLDLYCLDQFSYIFCINEKEKSKKKKVNLGMTFGVTVIQLVTQRVLTLTKNKKNLYIKEKLSPEDV